MSEPLSCEERGGFCAVRTLSERCQNTVRTLSERCQNGQVSVRTGAGAPQTRFDDNGDDHYFKCTDSDYSYIKGLYRTDGNDL